MQSLASHLTSLHLSILLYRTSIIISAPQGSYGVYYLMFIRCFAVLWCKIHVTVTRFSRPSIFQGFMAGVLHSLKSLGLHPGALDSTWDKHRNVFSYCLHSVYSKGLILRCTSTYNCSWSRWERQVLRTRLWRQPCAQVVETHSKE